jgi:hypothetical protein
MSVWGGIMNGAGMGAGMGGPWGALAGAGIGAVGGLVMGNRQAEQQKAQNRAAAEANRYSQWTNHREQMGQVNDPLNTALQGGTAGLMLGQQFGGKGGAQESAVGGSGGGGTSSPFGGTQMASQLGQFGNGAGVQAAQNALKSNQDGMMKMSLFENLPAQNDATKKFGLGNFAFGGR